MFVREMFLVQQETPTQKLLTLMLMLIKVFNSKRLLISSLKPRRTVPSYFNFHYVCTKLVQLLKRPRNLLTERTTRFVCHQTIVVQKIYDFTPFNPGHCHYLRLHEVE
jgi:hypothetical protein